MTYVVEYWYGDEHNEYRLDKTDIKCVTAYVSDREGDAQIAVTEISGATQLLKKNGAKWVLHCLSAPAYDTDTYVEYFVEGDSMTINDMPISEEEKCILVLKYGDNRNDHSYVYTK